MNNDNCKQAIQRYQRIFEDYIIMSQRIESCICEDKAFYQDVCLLFANKIKEIQEELSEQGFVLCRQSKEKTDEVSNI